MVNKKILDVLNEILFDITEGYVQLNETDLYPENLQAVYEFIHMNDFTGRFAEKLKYYHLNKNQ